MVEFQWRTARRRLLAAMWGVSIGIVLGATQGDRLFPISHSRLVAGQYLDQTKWVWPLAATAGLAVLTSPRIRRRWPEQAQRRWMGLAVALGLVALPILTIRFGPNRVLIALGAIVLVGLLALWVLILPNRMAPSLPATSLERRSDSERLEAANPQVKLHNELRTTALQAVAGLAVLAGAVLAFQQLTEDRQQAAADRELTRQGQASERFTRAISQLGSDRREVQLGGIYGLEHIAQQAPDNRLAVTEVLVAYMQRRAPRPAKPTTSAPDELRLRAPDIQAALTVLGRRKAADEDPHLDLRALDLSRAYSYEANLSYADLRESDLRRAVLAFADLSVADLRETDLRGAVLIEANFVDADLRGADLRGSDLSYADLSGADLIGADIRGANLSFADLRDADTWKADLRGASADENTSWPDDFNWRDAGVSMRR
jgi:hypothetical protein